jgi:hypothetical protein
MLKDAKKTSKEDKVMFITAIIIISPIILILVALLMGAINNNFITPKIIRSEAVSTFGSNEYSPVSGTIAYDNGFMILGLRADNEKQAMDFMRNLYLKLSKKMVTKSVDTISITVYFKETGSILLSSNITIEKIKNTNWKDIGTYEEFMQAANVTLK